MKTTRKALSLILALAMCISMISSVAFADGESDNAGIAVANTETVTPAVTFTPNPQLFDTAEPLGFVIDSAQAGTGGSYLGWHSLDAVASPTQKSGLNYKQYDENGYEITRNYTVTYTDAEGTEYTSATLTYAELMALIEETQVEGTLASVTSVKEGAYTPANNPATLYVGQRFTASHAFAIIGAALETEGMYNLAVNRNWSTRLAASQVSSGGTAASAQKDTDAVYSKYMAYLASADNYLYEITPNQDATIYYFYSAKTPADNSLMADWSFLDSSAATATLSEVPMESFTEPYQPLWAEGSTLNVANAVTGADISKAWYMVDSRYNPENYPYYMTKIQYDGHATVYATFPYMWYKEVKAGEAVKIPCLGSAGQETPRVMIRYGAHISDDVSGTITGSLGTAVDVDVREDASLDVNIDKGEEVTFVPTDSKATYEFSDTADFTDTYQVVDMSEVNEKTVYLKVTSEFGNDVVLTLKIKVSDNLNGTLKVGDKEILLTHKKHKYYAEDYLAEGEAIAVGDAIEFVPSDAYTEAVVSAQEVTSVPQLITVDVAAADGSTWTYSVMLENEDVYTFSDMTDPLGKFSAPKRLYGTEDDVTYTNNATTTDKGKLMTKESYDAVIERYGTPNAADTTFWAGTTGWSGYPSHGASSAVAGMYYVLSLSNATAENTNVLDREAYVFTAPKSWNDNTEMYDYGPWKGTEGYEEKVLYDGKTQDADGNLNYLMTFVPNKAGTMYIIKNEAVGSPVNAIAMGYEQDTSIKIFGKNPYGKHYEAGETVQVPSYGFDQTWLPNLTTSSNPGNRAISGKNSAAFVFVFDNERDASVSKISYNGTEATAVGDNEYELTLYDVADGDITLDVTTTDENAQAEEVVVTLEDGVGTAEFKVVSADGLVTASYTVTVIREAAQVSVSLETNGSDIKLGIDGGEKASVGVVKKAEYDFGTVIAAEAVGASGQEFMYWTEVYGSSRADVIISETPELEITAGSDRSFKAVFTDDEVYTVSFRSNGKIIADGASGTIAVPENPYIAGYEFLGWYLRGAKAELEVGAMPEVSENTTYNAGFKKSATKYSVSVDKGDGAVVTQETYNTKIEASALETKDGVAFSHWERDDIIVSYSTSYSFYVNADTVLEAVYAADAVVSDVVITMAVPTVVSGNKIAFYAERNVAESCTVVETGILLSQSADFDVNSAEIKAVATSTARSGQYTVRKANVTADQTWYGKAYVIYKDASGEIDIAYSDEVTGTLNN